MLSEMNQSYKDKYCMLTYMSYRVVRFIDRRQNGGCLGLRWREILFNRVTFSFAKMESERMDGECTLMP